MKIEVKGNEQVQQFQLICFTKQGKKLKKRRWLAHFEDGSTKDVEDSWVKVNWSEDIHNRIVHVVQEKCHNLVFSCASG